jgi:ACT domain-containing protein
MWEYPSGNETASMNFQVFKADDTPTVSDILSEAKSNVIELVAILQTILLNSPDASRLKAHLNSASIDLSNIVHSIRTLNQYHPSKYPIDEAQLQKLGTH